MHFDQRDINRMQNIEWHEGLGRAYCCGFLFFGGNVALIRKKKPKWQEGKWNGIGGKVELDETPLRAMVREFHEEANAVITDWRCFAILRHMDALIFMFTAKTDAPYRVRTMTDEPVEWLHPADFYRHKPIDNLHFLVPMAFSHTGEVALIHDPTEVTL